ncbi:protein of unknown function [Paenibacillus alvei]|uniref:Uncharacterized protein n=1 Tax=Paenibacillus alvei TaxID=44250 RepID=A0A383R4D1_PAEAL|nr:protein of unknown function [Paenibacillus alvei]
MNHRQRTHVVMVLVGYHEAAIQMVESEKLTEQLYMGQVFIAK